MSHPDTIPDHRIAEATNRLLETPLVRYIPMTVAEFAYVIGVGRASVYPWKNGTGKVSRKVIKPMLDREDAVGEWARAIEQIYKEIDHDAMIVNKARSRAKTRQLTSLLKSSTGGKKRTR